MLRIIAFSLVASASLFAQTSELSGRLTDPSGNVVPQAKVTVTRTATATVLNAETNDTGNFFFPNLQPGNYNLRVTKEGFKTLERDGITLITADRARLELRLDVGSLSDTITVVGDAPLVETGSPSISTSVTTQEYEQLPQVQYNRMRSPATFLYLAPGVQGKITTAGADNVSASNSIQIYGSQKTSNELYLDGLPGRTNFNETAPPLDSIGEFKLQANSLSAEYGNTGSAVVTFTTKSGTNDPHGLLFDIFRNNALDARSFLAPARSQIHQNEFGANFGAPVYIPKLYNGRNRTFFFFGYTGSRKTGLDQYQRLRVATPAQRNGDFSAFTRLIYDPATTRTSGSAFVRDVFPGNRIPANRIDPVAANVIKLLPDLNLTGAGTLNFQGAVGERLLNPDVITLRMDQNFGSKHRINGSYTRTFIPRENVTVGMADPFSDRTNQRIKSHMTHGGYDFTISPNLLNTFQMGFNTFANPFAGFYANQGYAAKFGLKNIVGDSFPVFTFTDGYTALGRADNSANVEQSFIAKNMLSWTKGRQVLKFGVEYRLLYSPVHDQSTSAGSYGFSNLATALPTSTGTTGDGFASFLLGQVNSASISYPFDSESRKNYWGGFVQDDIRLTRSLTLNLGIRYEVVTAPTEINDQSTIVDLNTPNPSAGGRLGASLFAGSGTGRTGSRTLLATRYDGFGPRLGFAWQLDANTVFRGGYGVYYSDNGIFAVTTGFRTLSTQPTLDQGVTPPFILSQGFNPVPTQLRLAPDLLNGQSVTAASGTSGAQPRTQNWTASLQRQFGANWAAELSYVANKSSRVSASGMVNLNQLDPQYLSLGTLLTQNVTSAAARAANIAIPYAGFTGTVAQALRPYPQYLTVTEQSAKAGKSFYNAFTARLRKRFSAGLTLDAHFTWSKNLGNVDSTVQNNFNRAAEKTLLNSDVPYAFIMHWSYALPFGPGKKWMAQKSFVSALASGWVVNGIHYYQSGTPLFITMNNNLPINNSRLRPNLVAGNNPATGIANGSFDPNTNSVINKAAFTAPAAFTFGNAANSYGSLRNFPVLQEDFSLLKDTLVKEKVTVQVIGQFINALNRHRFASVDSNFSNSTFGTISATNIARIVTLGLKVKF